MSTYTDRTTLPVNPVVQHLMEARALIADPKRWCRHALARNVSGCACEPTDTDATQFCARGAAARVEHRNHWSNELDDYLTRAALELFEAPNAFFDHYNIPVYVNNNLGHAATLAMYDHAIVLALSSPLERVKEGEGAA